MFARLGVHKRVIQISGVGGVDYLEMTAGHFAAISSWVRHELMVTAGLRTRRRTGKMGGEYKLWRVEMESIDA